MKLSCFLLLCSFTIISTQLNAQNNSLSQNMLESGRFDLSVGSQDALKNAKKSFRKAKVLFFYNEKIVNDANLGLSACYLKTSNSLKAIKLLKRIVGKVKCRNIEKGNLQGLTVLNRNDWTRYIAIKRIIKVYIVMKKKQEARNYLAFLGNCEKMGWTCGSGKLGHKKFMMESKDELKED